MANVLTTFKVECPVKSYITSTGTWAFTSNSGIPYLSKTATAETSKVVIPIPVLSRGAEFGQELLVIDIPIRVATANLVSAPTGTLYRRNGSLAVVGAGTNMTASAVTGTFTGNTITAAATDRLLRFTVTTPTLDYSLNTRATYNLELTFKAATTSAIRIYDAVAFFAIPE